MILPRIVHMVRKGASLGDLEATAGKLWLAYGGAELDRDGTVKQVIDAYWQGRPGADPYWDFLGTRGTCDHCGMGYKYENLMICPNCFKTYCYRHDRSCTCGHRALG